MPSQNHCLLAILRSVDYARLGLRIPRFTAGRYDAVMIDFVNYGTRAFHRFILLIIRDEF